MPLKALTLFLGLSVAIILCWLLQLLKFVFLPLVLAGFIAFLLNPLVGWLTGKKIPLVIAAGLAIMLTLAAIWLTGTIVLKNLASFQTEFPKYEEQVQELTESIKKFASQDLGAATVQRLGNEISQFSLGSIVGSILNSVFGFLTYLLFTFVFAVYLLIGSPKLPAKVRLAFSPDAAEVINEAIERTSVQVQRYIWAKTLTSVLTGACMVVVCLLFQVDFPITWGFFTFLLNWIPTIGVLAASIPPMVLVFLNTGSLMITFWMVVVLLVVFLSLGNYIEPLILGESVNLSPLVALFSLIFWGWLWGPAGMIVAVPVTALVKLTCDNIPSLKPIGILMGVKA